MALREFKLPDPGEGLTEADIVTWHVAVGDTVKVNDVVVEIETAKSLVELPVPFAGTVTAIHVSEGDTVEVGTPIISVDDGTAIPAAVEPSDGGAQAAAEAEVEEGLIGGTTSTGRTAVLVGYGVKQTEATRRPRVTLTTRRPEEHDPPLSPPPPLPPRPPLPPVKNRPIGRMFTPRLPRPPVKNRPIGRMSTPWRAGRASGRWPNPRCASSPRTSG